MTGTPLTHHEIIGIVAPFVRRGRHVDLERSDRLARRISFRVIDRAPAHGQPALREALDLECFTTGTFRLVRTLSRPDGLRATATVVGPSAELLLAAIDSVTADKQFAEGVGYRIARHYDLAVTSAAAGAGDPRVAATLTRGVVALEDLTVAFSVSTVRGVAAEIELTPAAAGMTDPPEDLLAVLGWNWARLVPAGNRWKSKLRLRGSGLLRNLEAERALDTAARHLAVTLAEAPHRFHERHTAARWGVFFRRAIPVLTIIGLAVGVAVLPRFAAERNPGMLMLLFHVPTVLIVVSLCLQELAQFEIPPWPRASTASSWWRPAPRTDVLPREANTVRLG